METHKDKNPFSVCFPALGHLLVFLLRRFHIHREYRPGAVDKVESTPPCLILCRQGCLFAIITYEGSG